jgi:uncharacterized RmlC-like cupin family protein
LPAPPSPNKAASNALRCKRSSFRRATPPITGIAEIAPGGTAGRHTHPGIETGYVLEGESDLILEGKPDQHLKAGDSYSIPAGVVHDAKVHGDKSLKIFMSSTKPGPWRPLSLEEATCCLAIQRPEKPGL